MFKTRLASGIVLVAVILLTMIRGGWLLQLTVLAVSLCGMHELYKVAGVLGDNRPYLAMTGYASALIYELLVFLHMEQFTEIMIIAALVALMCVYVFTFPEYRFTQIAAVFFGFVYVAVMLSFICRTRSLPQGEWTAWLIFLCSWGCDTCAYCVGCLFGKKKMAPVLSPKKSVEGAIGGVVGAAVLGGIFAIVAGRFIEGTPVVEYALICAAGALISMVGDLAASAIKRNFSVKDYGKLIPGHGGILDRFDSVIFTAPVIWFLATTML